MFEYIALVVIVAATLGVLWLAKRHGIILRPDAGGLEAIPKELLRAGADSKEKEASVPQDTA